MDLVVVSPYSGTGTRSTDLRRCPTNDMDMYTVLLRVETKDDARCPYGLIAEAGRCVVVSFRVPQAAAGDGNALILALADDNVDQDLVPWAVQLLPALCLDSVGNGLGQRLKAITKVCPFLNLLVVRINAG